MGRGAWRSSARQATIVSKEASVKRRTWMNLCGYAYPRFMRRSPGRRIQCLSPPLTIDSATVIVCVVVVDCIDGLLVPVRALRSSIDTLRG